MRYKYTILNTYNISPINYSTYNTAEAEQVFTLDNPDPNWRPREGCKERKNGYLSNRNFGMLLLYIPETSPFSI